MNRYAGKTRLGVVAIFFAAALAVLAIAASSAIRASVAAKHPERITARAANAPAAAAKVRVAGLYGKLPLSFEPNQGQSDKRVKFLSRGNGYSLFLTSTEAVLALRKNSAESKPSAKSCAAAANGRKRAEAGYSVLRISLDGAAKSPTVTGLDPRPGKANYLIGNDRRKWRTNIPTYSKVKISNAYPGIDVVYHGNNEGRLESDFNVAAGANYRAIRLKFDGAQNMKIDADGNLAVKTGGG